MIYVVRHGERADDVIPLDQQLFNKVDPPLTHKGIYQSYQTGTFISKFTPNIKKYLILSSPFQRCIETAIQIKSALQVCSQIQIQGDSIYVQNGIGEMLHPSWFQQNVTKELNIYKCPDSIQNIDKCSVKFEHLDEKFIEQQYPENFGEFYQRFFYNYRIMVGAFIEKYEADVGLVIVTHGYGVQVSLQNHLAMKKISDANYNCINVFEFDRKNQQNYQTLLKLYDGHLKDSKL